MLLPTAGDAASAVPWASAVPGVAPSPPVTPALLGVRLVVMLEERLLVHHPENIARGDARLEAALARLAHLLHLEASRLERTEVVQHIELAHDASEPLLLVGRRAALPVAALKRDILADHCARLGQGEKEVVRDERALRRRSRLALGHRVRARRRPTPRRRPVKRT
eukprot:7377106-Prymnesium_polylepis.1